MSADRQKMFDSLVAIQEKRRAPKLPLRVTALVPRSVPSADSAALWLYLDDHGRRAVAFAMSLADAARIGEELFDDAAFEASKLRSEVGTPLL